MSKKRLSKWLLLGSALMAVLLVVAACAAKEEEATAPKGTVRLAELDWTGQLLENELVKITLGEDMGYEVTTTFVDVPTSWAGIAAGDLDIGIEYWPSYQDLLMKQYIAEYGGDGTIEYVGPTGILGTSGYYVPTYVIEGDSERGIEPLAPDLKDWRDLNRYKDLFVQPETAPKGRWVGTPIVGWQGHDEERIANLGLEYQHIYMGSDTALIAEIEAAYARGEPILFYMWGPHWIHAKYDFTQIPMPEYSDECWGYVEGVEPTYACGFPVDVTFIISNPDWAEENPEAAQFFRNFRLTNEQQEEMILAVEVEGKTVEQVARDWIAENENVWRAWIPAGY